MTLHSSTLEILQTHDGSHTVRLIPVDVTFHSMHGAITESRHVFIEHGLDSLFAEQAIGAISIFEVGFGTGLNALLSAQWSTEKKVNIKYQSVETHLLPKVVVKELNYPELLHCNPESFYQLHKGDSSAFPYFEIEIHPTSILEFVSESEFDLIYLDAFGPGAQPEMWQKSTLKKLYDLLKPYGRMVTFCAQGQFKRDLKSLGFEVEAKPGPPGKREMTLAIKT